MDTLKKAEQMEVQEAEVVTTRKPSALGTLKSFKENNRKLKELKLINNEQFKQLEELQEKALLTFVKTLK